MGSLIFDNAVIYNTRLINKVTRSSSWCDNRQSRSTNSFEQILILILLWTVALSGILVMEIQLQLVLFWGAVRNCSPPKVLPNTWEMDSDNALWVLLTIWSFCNGTLAGQELLLLCHSPYYSWHCRRLEGYLSVVNNLGQHFTEEDNHSESFLYNFSIF